MILTSALPKVFCMLHAYKKSDVDVGGGDTDRVFTYAFFSFVDGV